MSPAAAIFPRFFRRLFLGIALLFVILFASFVGFALFFATFAIIIAVFVHLPFGFDVASGFYAAAFFLAYIFGPVGFFILISGE